MSADLSAALRDLRDRIDELIAMTGGESLPAYMTDPLEHDGAWRPAWLVELNAQARAHRPDGMVYVSDRYRPARMTLLHSILWWPIYFDRELTAEQRAEYEKVQRDGFGQWIVAQPSSTPIIYWPRENEDDSAAGAEVRGAILAGPSRETSVIKTEDELRAMITRYYKIHGYLP